MGPTLNRSFRSRSKLQIAHDREIDTSNWRSRMNSSPVDLQERPSCKVGKILPVVTLLCLAVATAAQSQSAMNSAASLSVLTPEVNSRQVSPENPTGEKG